MIKSLCLMTKVASLEIRLNRVRMDQSEVIYLVVGLAKLLRRRKNNLLNLQATLMTVNLTVVINLIKLIRSNHRKE